MDKKIGIIFTSRNNYNMLENWIEMVDTENFEILNIDEDSTEENKLKGKNLCEKKGITYMDREDRGMHFNFVTACNFYEPKGIEWILWFAHDCYPKRKNFFTDLNEVVSKPSMKEFGVIGFNVLHNDLEINSWNANNNYLGHLCRSPLQEGGMYYRPAHHGDSRAKLETDDRFRKPFSVESTKWDVGMFNISQYKKFIEPSDQYQFFHAWDDICFQFLYNNVHNLCLPQFTLAHEQLLKPKFGLPRSSPSLGEAKSYTIEKDGEETEVSGNNKEVREHFYGKWGHLDVWKERWGFDYADRTTFESVKENYVGTLLWDFYHHDPQNGPLKSFDL